MATAVRTDVHSFREDIALMAEDDIEMNTKGLDQLIKAFKGDLPKARVGILGSKGARTDSKIGSTNASIGAIHEFGTSTMPQRSFLRVPLAEHLQKKMESSGAFDKSVLAQVIKQGSVLEWMKKMAVLAESIVAEAFATKGFGKWPAWRTAGYTNKGNTLLVDTGQLRDSITSEVK